MSKHQKFIFDFEDNRNISPDHSNFDFEAPKKSPETPTMGNKMLGAHLGNINQLI